MASEATRLDFPMMAYGTHEWPYDFKVLTHLGGAATPRNLYDSISDDQTKTKRTEARLPLVTKLHESIVDDITRGIRQPSAVARIRSVILFYAWADTQNKDITLENYETLFQGWVESLLHRVKIKKEVKQMTAYRCAKAVDRLLSKIFGLRNGPIKKTRLSAPNIKKRVLGTQADKQNLHDTFEFGRMLLTLVRHLDFESISQPLPLFISFPDGQTLDEWSGFPKPSGPNVNLIGKRSEAGKYRYRDRSKRLEIDTSLKTRQPLVNLRIEAELLIFIAQTGINLQQAYNLKKGDFRYQTDSDELDVYRVVKGRRQGEAEFRIHKEYKIVFKKYLEWLDKAVKDDERLFPFTHKHQIPSIHSTPSFHAVIKRCKLLNIKYFPPSQLRSTRVNWLLRKSRDPSLTAEMSQHTEQVLIRVYEKPHHQSAAAEITRFHRMSAPSTSPPSPGLCTSLSREPAVDTSAPIGTPKPDCVNAAGCLFCSYHRDIDSLDHVWSLATYRALKVMEVEKFVAPTSPPSEHPSVLLINRITMKIKFYKESNAVRQSWVTEAVNRIREERYHPMFSGLIELAELSP